MTCSCRSKKKLVEKSSELVKTELAIAEVAIETTDIDLKTKGASVSEVFSVSKNDVLELTQADPDKSITITNANGDKMSIKGANVKISKKESSTVAKDSSHLEAELNAINAKNKTKNLQLEASSKKDKRNTDVDIKSTSTWLWLLLIVAVVCFLVYKYRFRFF